MVATERMGRKDDGDPPAAAKRLLPGSPHPLQGIRRTGQRLPPVRWKCLVAYGYQ
jgi:hypothetical protein